MATLAQKIKGLREVKKLGRTQLADKVGMERSYLYQIESGQQKNPGLRILRGLADELDVSIDYLADDSTDEHRSWEKVATDESLELLLKKSNLSEEERAGLRRISFRNNAPYTLKGWEETWDHINTYFSPKRSSQPSRKRRNIHKDTDSKGFPTDFPTSDMGHI
ncbi:MAG: helix-turn-helix domain-containing protein [Promethearchaeota archaeon]